MVSVVIPTYNRAEALKDSVRSVLEQTYQDIELIVVDDGSSDNTKGAVESFVDPRLRYVYQENAGACAARNHGVLLARGELIAFHDSDDIWYPDKLEKQVKAIKEHDADIVICKLLMRQASGKKVLYPKRISEGFVSSSDDLFGIGTQTILARREVMENEPFDKSLPRYQDLEWVYRVLKHYDMYCLDEALVDYSIGADSISSDPVKMYRSLDMIIKKYPELPRKYPVLSMHIVKNLLENRKAFKARNKRVTGAYIKLILRYYPGLLRFAAIRIDKRNRVFQDEVCK